MNLNEKLKRLITNELPILADDIIIENDNSYLVFKNYVIEKNSGLFDVYFHDELTHQFSTSTSAISWCVAEKYRRLNLSRRIVQLDSYKLMLDNDISTSKNMVHSSKNAEFKELAEVKLKHKLDRRAAVKSELSKCCKIAKYIQISRIKNNETGRTCNN